MGIRRTDAFPSRDETSSQPVGHIPLRLNLVIIAWIIKRGVLERRPAKKGVVSYERRDFAIWACHEDTLLDMAGKVRNRNSNERAA